jgi:hypothetical protein
LILRSSVRYSDTIPCAYLRYDSVSNKGEKISLLLTHSQTCKLQLIEAVPCVVG